MISDIEHELSKTSYQKYIENTHLGLLTETHEVLLRLIKTPNIHIFKMAAPTEDHFPLVCQEPVGSVRKMM